MRAWALIILAAALLTACAQLPKIALIAPDDAPLARCEQRFVQGRWQFHHLIEASVYGRSMGRLTGVSVISADERIIDCALMTIEGLVLFSARYDGTISVTRAVAPFDRPGVAQGLVEDLKLLYFKPAAPLQACGRLANKDTVCRYGTPGGETTDVVVKDSHHWAIYSYNTHGRAQRTIEAIGPTAEGAPPEELTIQSHGRMKYFLKLRLLEALPLDK
jgi:hypothetical protein